MGAEMAPEASQAQGAIVDVGAPTSEYGAKGFTGDFSCAETKSVPWSVVAMPAFAFAGVQLGWAVQIGHATAYLRKLGLPDEYVGLAWLAGPVTGTLVQPVVGILSDGCTHRLGRRRPYMLVGTGMVVVGLLTFSNADLLGELLGDPVNPNGGGSKTGLSIAIASFWLTDFSINLLQTPTRALLADLVPARQLPLGNSFFAVANGLGKSIGYALGAFTSGVRVTFAAAACGIVALTVVPVLWIQERQLEEHEKPVLIAEDDEAEAAEATTGFARTLHFIRSVLQRSFRALTEMPTAMRRVFAVQFLTYLALMFLFIYGSDWAGRELYHGNADAAPGSPEHAAFDRGVRAANMGFLLMSVLSMVLAPLIPLITRIVGVRTTWFLSLLTLATALLLTPLHPPELPLLAALSLPLSTAFTLPWALATLSLATAETAAPLAAFNLSQATPGLVASTAGSAIVRAARGNLSAVLAAGGVAAALAAAAVWTVDVPAALRSDGLRSGWREALRDYRRNDSDATCA